MHCDSEKITYQIQTPCMVAKLVTSETTAQCSLYPSTEQDSEDASPANYLRINKETFDILLKKKSSHTILT